MIQNKENKEDVVAGIIWPVTLLLIVDCYVIRLSLLLVSNPPPSFELHYTKNLIKIAIVLFNVLTFEII